MDDLGQFGPISVLIDREVTGAFTVRKIEKLSKPEQPCEPAEHYSYNDCLRRYISRTTECSVDILSNNFNCTSDGLPKLLNTLDEIKLSSKRSIIRTTGCLPKCTTHSYDFHLTDDEDAIWRKDWISSFYLSTRTTTNHNSVETYSYDEQVLKLNTCGMHIF